MIFRVFLFFDIKKIFAATPRLPAYKQSTDKHDLRIGRRFQKPIIPVDSPIWPQEKKVGCSIRKFRCNPIG